MREILIKMFFHIIEMSTPEFRKALCETLSELKKKAKETQSIWDDFIIDMLLAITACKKDE